MAPSINELSFRLSRWREVVNLDKHKRQVQCYLNSTAIRAKSYFSFISKRVKFLAQYGYTISNLRNSQRTIWNIEYRGRSFRWGGNKLTFRGGLRRGIEFITTLFIKSTKFFTTKLIITNNMNIYIISVNPCIMDLCLLVYFFPIGQEFVMSLTDLQFILFLLTIYFELTDVARLLFYLKSLEKL